MPMIYKLDDVLPDLEVVLSPEFVQQLAHISAEDQKQIKKYVKRERWAGAMKKK